MENDIVPKPGGKFVKVKCPDCGNIQITYTKPATVVQCQVCGATLVKATGGKGDFRGEIVGDAE